MSFGAGPREGAGDLPAGWSAWLVKFPTVKDDADVGRREHAWMAAAAGVEVPKCRILPLAGIGDAFAVRRFDRRPGGERVHMRSAAGALSCDLRTARADYEHLLRATLAVCGGDQAQVHAMFRLAAFNVASVNEDDHLKNFAFLLDATGRWRLAPAFDLTYSPLAVGGRWTTVCDVGREITRVHFLELASRTGIKPGAARRILEDVTTATNEERRHLRAAGCDGPVSRAAGTAVAVATARLRG
ncbi:hypothetical protein LBMAG42_00690 [Deltaproteobacteria bacterium]|nr:hypothetical protein LBMAG42_00690 [Deltaproteobacteria bacterium]